MTPLSATLQGNAGSHALDVSLELSGTITLVGPNGAGKSTLVSMLLGLAPVTSGTIRLGDDVLLDTARGVNVPLESRGLGWVPQRGALFPHLTVRENVTFAANVAARALKPERTARAESLLAELQLTELANRRVTSLSGGERQRVALARALSTNPRALLLDEPMAALDVTARRDVRAFLAGWLTRLPIPCLVVTHDPDDAKSLGQSVVVLEAGRITQRGPWNTLSTQTSPFLTALSNA